MGMGKREFNKGGVKGERSSPTSFDPNAAYR